jgi:membrane-associated HD superfamily phosphohydrolase
MTSQPVTQEMIQIYVSALEKQVAQATLIVKTLEELNDKMKEVNAHLTNGLKSEITNHVTQEIDKLYEKIESSSNMVAIIREHISEVLDVEKAKAEISRDQIEQIKDLIVSTKMEIVNLKSSMKIDRAISIGGLASFVLTMLTMILRMWGKL